MKKNTTLTRNLFKFAFVSLALSFLASCSTTTQFATRKYTKGHFSDPIAKVNVNYLPSVSASAALAPVKQVQTLVTETQKTSKISTNSTPVAETHLNAVPKKGISFTTKEKSVKIAVANAPASINKGNVSLSENSVTAVTQTADHGSIPHHGFIWYALVCLLLAILFTILGIAVYVFLILAYIFWLAFLVFIVLALLVLLGLIG